MEEFEVLGFFLFVLFYIREIFSTRMALVSSVNIPGRPLPLLSDLGARLPGYIHRFAGIESL